MKRRKVLSSFLFLTFQCRPHRLLIRLPVGVVGVGWLALRTAFPTKARIMTGVNRLYRLVILSSSPTQQYYEWSTSLGSSKVKIWSEEKVKGPMRFEQLVRRFILRKTASIAEILTMVSVVSLFQYPCIKFTFLKPTTKCFWRENVFFFKSFHGMQRLIYLNKGGAASVGELYTKIWFYQRNW